MEVLTITAPETFNFQAVVVASMGWHVLAGLELHEYRFDNLPCESSWANIVSK